MLITPAAVLPGKVLLVPTEQQLCGRQNSSRRLGEGNNSVHHLEVEPLFGNRSNCSLFIKRDTLRWFHLRC